MAATAAKQEKHEVTYTATKSDSKKAEQVQKMVKALKSAKSPLVFSELCSKVGAKYPQDVEAAAFALEAAGLVKRLDAKNGSGRAHAAYEWTA